MPMESLVEFHNRSGKWLRGMIHRPPSTPQGRRTPGVIFFHGFTGDRMESHWLFVKCSRALAKAGIASMRFDFYGSGESEGEFRDVTLQGEISDARAAVDYFRAQKVIDSKRVGLIGLSLGGAIAATIAPLARVRALALWAALAHPNHLRTLAETASTPIAGSDENREFGSQEISPRFLDRVHKIDPLKSIARFKRPTLIIHPEMDAYLPLSHPEDFYRAAGSAIKEKVIVAGADHTFTSLAWERDVIERTVAWFQKYLLG
jgi:dipeptidyl aminopeptidase/acylaminoacyl peptidase